MLALVLAPRAAALPVVVLVVVPVLVLVLVIVLVLILVLVPVCHRDAETDIKHNAQHVTTNITIAIIRGSQTCA